MDLSKIPILNRFDLNDKTSRLKLILLLSALVVTVVLICIVLAPEKSPSVSQKPQQAVVVQPLDIQHGEADDNLTGRRNTDIYGRGRGGKRLADELFGKPDTTSLDDPLGQILKNGEKPRLEIDKGEASIMPGQPGVYGERNVTTSRNNAQLQQDNNTGRSSGTGKKNREERDRQFRDRLIAMGIDPETGQPFEQTEQSGRASGSTATSSSVTTVSSSQPRQEQQVVQAEIAVSEDDFLDDDNSFGMGASGISSISKTQKRSDGPSIKVMFIEEKKVKSGDRVQLRLCEEKGITVEGVHIPKNSLLYASVTLEERLMINVASVNVNGKIIPLNLEAYDVDGLKGIYCPVSESEDAIKEGVKEAGRLVTGAVSGVMRSYGARLVTSGQSTADRLTSSKYVYITSGYSFRLMQGQ